MMIQHTTEKLGTIAWAIDCAHLNLEGALKLESDRQAACAYARNVYGNLCRGMYKSVMARAKKGAAAAKAAGLTMEKPYFIKDGMIWGLHDDTIAAYR